MITCHNCNQANRLGAFYCKFCGLSLACPRCRVILQEPADYCDNCGQALSAGDMFNIAPISQFQRQAPRNADIKTGSSHLAPGVQSTAPDLQPPYAKPTPRELPDPVMGEEHAQSSLQKFIPTELVTKLEAARSNGTMAGERRVVTMLFCDVKGSTGAAEQLDPEEWTEIINGAFEQMIKPVYTYEGTVARLMGDGILAFFGAPIAHEDDPQRAILAGLDIIASIKPYREAVKQRHGLDFDVRVGINTGEVVVGAVGSDLRMEYTAMGDAINLAARMEQMAQPGTVQISEETHRLVAPLFEFEDLGEIEVKGKANPVLAYRVLRRKAAPGRLRGIEGLEAPLIGRESEWSRLTATADALQKGVGQIVLLIGEAGLGKSRLIRELHQYAANGNEEPVDWYETTSLSYETAQPYSLFQRLARRVCGITNNDPPEIVRDKLESMVATMPEDRQPQILQVFESLFGLASSNGRPPLQGENFKGQLFVAIEALWRFRANATPIVLVCDDLHWSDPASVALLQHLFPLTNEVPLMLLCATRPDRSAPGWSLKQVAGEEFSHRYTEINVRPLTAEDSDTLVDNLLTISDLPAGLRSRILEKAEGNPFFVEEVVRSLIETESVVRTADGMHWQATNEGKGIDIPDNLQALLTARMDRLEEDTKRILQLAALIGRSFFYRVLQMIAEGEFDQVATSLKQGLDTLQRVDLIREAARLPELEYMFRHSLTQEAAYRTILLKQRRAYHRRVGEAIEILFPEKVEEQAPTLAHHFHEAGDLERALRYATMAGDVAFRLFANTEAVEHYSLALDLAKKTTTGDEQLIHLYRNRGRALELENRYPEAETNYLELEVQAEKRGEQVFRLAALNARATIHSTGSPLNDPEKGRDLAEEALALARELGDRAGEAKAQWNLLLGGTYFGLGLPEGIIHGEQSLAITRELDLREQMAFTLHDLSAAYAYSERVDEYRAASKEARQLFRELGNMPMLATSYMNTAGTNQAIGDLEAGLTATKEALRISQAVGNRWNEAMSLAITGWIWIDLGDATKALTFLEEGLQIGLRAGLPLFEGWVGLLMTSIYAQAGAREWVIERLESLIPALDQTSMPAIFGWILRRYCAYLYLEVGEPAAAQVLMNEDRPPGSKMGGLGVFNVYGKVAEAKLAMTLDETERAKELTTKLVAKYRRSEMQYILPAALRLYGRAQANGGDRQAARAALLEARTLAQRRQMRHELRHILTELIDLTEDPAEVEAYKQEARDVLTFISDHAPPDLREMFLNQPEVKSVLDETALVDEE